MPFDGLFTNALLSESQKIVGQRIDRIYQPQDDTVTISLRHGSVIVFCTNLSAPRFYLANKNFPNPMIPPTFCMVLRKHLQGGYIESFNQLSNDRIIVLNVVSSNELGYRVKKSLVMEIMGKHSNLILIDSESNIIIDSIRRVTENMSRLRQILPGEKYDPSVLLGDKINPLSDCNLPSVAIEKNTKSTWRSLLNTYMGLSPLVCRHMCSYANIDGDTPFASLDEFQLTELDNSFLKVQEIHRNNDIEPLLYLTNKNGKEEELYHFHLMPLGNFHHEKYDDLSSLVERFYLSKQDEMKKSQRQQALRKLLRIRLDRQRNKYEQLKIELEDAKNREYYKVCGDLLAANANAIDPYLEQVILDNFYDPEMKPITIKMDPTLTAMNNAHRYYKQYQKLKNAALILDKQIIETERRINYLENTLYDISIINHDDDLEVIRQTLQEDGYLKSGKKKKSGSIKLGKPVEFSTPDGFSVLVGRNRKQNDQLTFKISHKDDLWFHVKGYAGSHVILRTNGSEASVDSIEFAAKKAAEFSQVKGQGPVEVDYTKRRNVSRIPGGGPGLVHYDNQQTIIIE
ncbi:MAG: fibronectin/fibrinogen-binding protein [Tissierellia bacterium]|nr:fibronectin/fibrinogen-binding protein [Tissierellia bacterium]